MKRYWHLVLILVIALAASPLLAQRVATQKRGISSAASSFQSGNIDSIGLFTGSATFRIPLGLQYPVGPDFSYQFLVYLNSSAWDVESVVCNEGPYGLPVPDDKYNVGTNGMVHFGRISFAGTHYTYLAQDGAQHGLYPRLHPNYPATIDPNVFYSTSSSYFRMRRYPSGSTECKSAAVPSPECMILDLAGGVTHEFRPRTVAGETVYMPTRMADAYGNDVDITYPAAGTSWTITDTHGRSHEISFAGTPGHYRRITEIKLATFGGGQATYKLPVRQQDVRAAGIRAASLH